MLGAHVCVPSIAINGEQIPASPGRLMPIQLPFTGGVR